jgi:hypothetical protein
MPDRLYSDSNIISSSTATTNIVFASPFKSLLGISITADNMNSGDYYRLTNKTAGGFSVDFFNSSNTRISRVFDWLAKGY